MTVTTNFVVTANSCYDKVGRNSCYDKTGLNSCYNKADRNSYYDENCCIGILLRILRTRSMLSFLDVGWNIGYIIWGIVSSFCFYNAFVFVFPSSRKV